MSNEWKSYPATGTDAVFSWDIKPESKTYKSTLMKSESATLIIPGKSHLSIKSIHKYCLVIAVFVSIVLHGPFTL